MRSILRRPSASLFGFALLFAACGGSSAATPEPRPAPPRSEPAPVENPAAMAPAPQGQTLEQVDTVDAPEGMLPAPPAAGLDTIQSGRFDQGKMWTFDVPPVAYFQEAYGIEADSAWFARARLGALRIPSCSASFVSPDGLVLTNHHCARDFITQVSTGDEGLLDEGFYARNALDERWVEGFTADQLIYIEDVSDRMDEAVDGRVGPERQERIEEEGAEIQEEYRERFAAEGNVEIELVSLYNGARYSVYVFRRYTRAKLVMAPELQIGFFGGDADNFTYPRYNLDFALFRIFDEGGDPVDSSEWYFPWSMDGVSAGDAVFIVGNPGSTSRLQTVAELEFRRDYSDKAVLAFLRRRAAALEEYIETWPEEAERYDLRNAWFSAMNSIKAYEGQLAGLADPEILARRWDTERDFLQALRQDSLLNLEYGHLVREMAELQVQKRELAAGLGSFLALTAENLASPTLHRAFLAYQVVNARQSGAPDGAVAGLIDEIDAVGSVPPELDEWLIEARIQDFMEYYGPQERWVGAILRGRTPEGVAASIVANSVLADSASASDGIRRGLISVDDPALRLVGFYVPAFVRFQQAFSELSQEEARLAEQLGRARYEIYGTDLPPDATFSLRIADGVVEGYDYNGTEAPVHTTFFGMYDRHYAFEEQYGEMSPWALPDRWLPIPEGLELRTPVNFVSTADIIGGNSGSPVLNERLEVVGVVFDGNIESLPGDYIYLPEANRSVTVDARGILEALRTVYDMERIVEELTGATAGVR